MKKTELLYKHKMIRNVVNDMHVSIVIFDKKGRRIFANPQYYFMTGKRPGSKSEDKFNPADEAKKKDGILDKKIYEALQNGRISEIHNYLYQPKLRNNRRYFDFLIGPLRDDKNDIIGAYSMAKDETARFLAKRKLENLNKNLEKIIGERTENLKKANTKLRRVADDKNILVSHVAHEIKTILTVIKGNVDLINVQLQSRDPLVLECNSEINNEIYRMSNIVSDLVFIAKSEAYADLFKLERLDLLKEIKLIIKKYELIQPNSNFKISVSGEADQSIFLMADKLKITTLVDNMIENAIKYGKPDGNLKISLKKDSKGTYINFKDNGQGIEKEKIDYIFDPFFQTRKTNDLKINRGFGLGLAICKKIVAAHKGNIRVISELGRGTEFIIMFPR